MRARTITAWTIAAAIAALGAGCMDAKTTSDASISSTNVRSLHPAGFDLQRTSASGCTYACNFMDDCGLLWEWGISMEDCIQYCETDNTLFEYCAEMSSNCTELRNCLY